MEKIIKNIKWIVFAVCCLTTIAILCGILAAQKNGLQIDLKMIDLVLNNIRNNVLTVIFKIITFFGEAKLLIPVGIIGAGVGFFFFKDHKRTVCFAGNLVLIAGINWVVKHLIQRPRPDESLRLVTEDGYSYPSGHAMVTTAFYGLIIYFVYNNVKNKILRNCICTGLVLLILLIDFSRVYLGVHYLSDVVSGTLISISYLIVATTIAKKYMFND